MYSLLCFHLVLLLILFVSGSLSVYVVNKFQWEKYVRGHIPRVPRLCIKPCKSQEELGNEGRFPKLIYNYHAVQRMYIAS